MSSDSASGGAGGSSAGFPFHPFQDFLLGEVLLKTLLETGVTSESAEEAVLSHLSSDSKNFVFTPNAKNKPCSIFIPKRSETF